MRRSLAVVVALILSSLSACGTEREPAATPATSSSSAPASAAPLPSPSGKPVLVIKGGTTPVSLDLAGLATLPQVEGPYYEPFVKKDVTFRGVDLAALLARAGVTTGKVRMHALDDYTWSGEVSYLRDGKAIVATHADGKPIPLADGGPIRVVFPDGRTSKNTDAWVWSLDSIATVR